MNHNYFIILFLAIFLIQIEKIHGGCRPVGYGDQTKGGSEIQKVTFSSGRITVTTNIKEKFNGNVQYTEAIGHFTFNYKDHNGKDVSVRINKKPEFVNEHYDCNPNVNPNEVNPYTKIWEFDSALTPPSGTDVAVYLSIYWQCAGGTSGNGALDCNHEDVSYQTKA
ncbi:765_t:CDS:2 [Dentiscutata erythropus]|uniref:765_t:CDS:1 n=1 Tax=Dentiscutata erythropus TaxID=1348616 RepID=A0A9N9HYU0_9GLOM|nr:765_t:CDS:2 [Dentiscutata erythropus]